MKNVLYSRVRQYTWLIILTLTVSFAAASSAFVYFELQIESDLDRQAHFHSRSTQLAVTIKEQLVPLRVLVEAHEASDHAGTHSALDHITSAQAMAPQVLYNTRVSFDQILELHESYGGSRFDQTVERVERAISDLAAMVAAPPSENLEARWGRLETAVRALILSADQLQRLHLVAADSLDLKIEAEIERRNVVLVSLVTTIAVVAVVALFYLMAQMRRAFVRQETADRSRLESDKRHQSLVDTSPNGILEVDLSGTVVFANKAFSRMLQIGQSDLVGEKIWAFLADEEARGDLRDQIKSMIESQSAGLPMSTKIRRNNGKEVAVEITWGFRHDAGGSLTGLIAVISDITARLELEAYLRQSQKMEAIGQLTGGVAHEFNNLLGVVQGNAELLSANDGKDASLIDPILRATARGSSLTRQLLSFARKQSLNPEAVDVGALITDMSRMLERTLRGGIEIKIVSQASLWTASADASQLEAALLNLAINARDAMPSGGKLTLRCSNVRLKETNVGVHPGIGRGDYVLIEVKDNGIGMSEEVRAQAFEPFFTTKEVGRGTGLGLSMVYGFAEQSGGCAAIASTPGQGTTVSICLPREKAAPRGDTMKERVEIPRGHGESVLVIEDDREMRELAVTMLKGLGYRATEVPEAASARAALERGEDFDLVLSDIVLPGGVTGPQFVAEMTESQPGFKVIFMSGYPDEAVKHQDLIGHEGLLLQKPFRRRDLAKAVRAALD